MNRVIPLLLTLLTPLAITAPVHAGSSVRYALVVGNNHGHTDAVSLDDLQRAEAEARDLRESLLQFGNFDPDRVALVVGEGRAEILAAAEQLAAHHRRDREELGPLPTLFVFFFTGHGMAGQLLTEDAPLTGEDLATIYQGMNATLSLGVFDACFSESLALRGKGAIATPGFNPLTELPKEVLNAEGSVWFVSSRPEEQSYEDTEVGSLFTHYFLQAFTDATPDGVAITLDQMWEYARRRTTAHAAKYGRSQTPVKIVRHLKSRGPLYFSFPAERRARVRFTSEVEGRFLVQYQHGALVEQIRKPAGESMEVALYEGEVLLSRVDGGHSGQAPAQRLTLRPGHEVTVRPRDTAAATTALGYGEGQIRAKGELPELMVTERRERPSVAISAGYGLALTRPGVLGGLHRLDLGSAFAYGPFSIGLDLVYGFNTADYEVWGYALHEVGLRAAAGYGLHFDTLRLDLEAGVQPNLSFVSYASGRERQQVGLWIGAGTRVRWPLPFFPSASLQGRAGLGALRSEGIAWQDQEAYWSPMAHVDVGLAFTLINAPTS